MRLQRFAWITASGTLVTYCRKCEGILEYVYHIYYKCRRCGEWAKRS